MRIVTRAAFRTAKSIEESLARRKRSFIEDLHVFDIIIREHALSSEELDFVLYVRGSVQSLSHVG